MDPRYLIISPEDEEGGRQRRFFGWLIWGLIVAGIFVALLLTRMWWQAAVFAGIVASLTIGAALLNRWALRGTD
jgi:hypothetical protein